MKYLHNNDWGFMLYPKNDEDVEKVKKVKEILGADLEDVWSEVTNKYAPQHHTVAIRSKNIKDTGYPNEGSC